MRISQYLNAAVLLQLGQILKSLITAVLNQLQTVPFLPLAENYLSTLDSSKATLDPLVS
jgi:hypothetical protein